MGVRARLSATEGTALTPDPSPGVPGEGRASQAPGFGAILLGQTPGENAHKLRQRLLQILHARLLVRTRNHDQIEPHRHLRPGEAKSLSIEPAKAVSYNSVADLARYRQPDPKVIEPVGGPKNQQPAIACRAAALIDPAKIQRGAQVLSFGQGQSRAGRFGHSDFDIRSSKLQTAHGVCGLQFSCPRRSRTRALRIQLCEFLNDLPATVVDVARHHDLEFKKLIAAAGDALAAQSEA